jgi:nucleoside-diphosphate-sugar epimerase
MPLVAVTGWSLLIVIMSSVCLLHVPRLVVSFRSVPRRVVRDTRTTRALSSSSSSNSNTNRYTSEDNRVKGKLLVLGGTGFLGQTVCKRAIVEGYDVTSLSRRGLPPVTASDKTVSSSSSASSSIMNMASSIKIDYRQGDARQKDAIEAILNEGGYVGVIHTIGLLFDETSGIGSYNRFVSGSGSLPDADSTYDTITRLTAFHAIDAASEYAARVALPTPLPFVFTSAAEAGWPDVTGGNLIENKLAPDFLKRYLRAKRQVEAKLLDPSTALLRPIIPRPSLIYSMDRPTSFPPVGAFFIGNALGLPFVDRPVTVQALASAMVRAIGRPEVRGILRYPQIDQLNE